MNGNTSIQLSKKHKNELDNLKLSKSESYDDVIGRLIDEVIDELGFTLYNSIFHIECIADVADENEEHWYFLNELGEKTEFLEPTEEFVNREVQEEYLSFIKAINQVCTGDLTLLDHGCSLGIGEIHQFDGFKMKRTY